MKSPEPVGIEHSCRLGEAMIADAVVGRPAGRETRFHLYSVQNSSITPRCRQSFAPPGVVLGVTPLLVDTVTE